MFLFLIFSESFILNTFFTFIALASLFNSDCGVVFISLTNKLFSNFILKFILLSRLYIENLKEYLRNAYGEKSSEYLKFIEKR